MASRPVHPALRNALLITALLAVATSCGASKSGAPSVASLAEPTATSQGASADAATATTVSFEEAAAKYTACMSDAGFDTDIKLDTGNDVSVGDTTPASVDPQKVDANADPAAWEAADKRCTQLMSDAISTEEATPEQQAAFDDAFLKYQQCMQAEGMRVENDNGMITGGPDKQTSSTDPQVLAADAAAYDAADKKCQWALAELMTEDSTVPNGSNP